MTFLADTPGLLRRHRLVVNAVESKDVEAVETYDNMVFAEITNPIMKPHTSVKRRKRNVD